MTSRITLLDEKVTIYVDRKDFYETMLEAITRRVFQLLGHEFDKRAYLEEVENSGAAVELGQELAIPVSMLLSIELGFCLGQLKALGKSLDADKALEDLYRLWKIRLKKELGDQMIAAGTLH